MQDAAASFHYPETITSVSYTLRKAYTALLWDYEQVYFFRVRAAWPLTWIISHALRMPVSLKACSHY